MTEGPGGVHFEDSEGAFVLVGGYAALLDGEVTKWQLQNLPPRSLVTRS